MDILSTRSVAEMLGVSEATVKRWSDAGTVKCFRTPGGHRKFRLRDVNAFLSDQAPTATPAAAKRPSSTPAMHGSALHARQLALAADVDGVISFIASRRMEGLTIAQVFDQCLAPAAHSIGDDWAQGRVSAAQEHIASSTLVDALSRIRPLVENRDIDRGRALCACMGHERHDLALRMTALVLDSEGYRAAMLGGNVPAADLALMVSGVRPALLALSASSHSNLEHLKGDLAIIASAAHAAGTQVVVGGAGFSMMGSPLPTNVELFPSLHLFALSMAGPLAKPARAPARARSMPT
jgi:MerR family transcriptional regulator, light-induced transcriptional regulator